MSTSVELLRRLGDVTKDFGLIVCLENYEFWLGDDFERLFTYCDRDNLGVINRTGNWLISGDDPLMETLLLRHWIVGMHLKYYALEMGCCHSQALGPGWWTSSVSLRPCGI